MAWWRGVRKAPTASRSWAPCPNAQCTDAHGRRGWLHHDRLLEFPACRLCGSAWAAADVKRAERMAKDKEAKDKGKGGQKRKPDAAREPKPGEPAPEDPAARLALAKVHLDALKAQGFDVQLALADALPISEWRRQRPSPT